MSDVSALHRISTAVEGLMRGDVLRDHGRNRRVDRIEASSGTLAYLVIVFFEEDDERPELPPTLAIPAAQVVTAWRAND